MALLNITQLDVVEMVSGCLYGPIHVARVARRRGHQTRAHRWASHGGRLYIAQVPAFCTIILERCEIGRPR
jgi:hypothetical protein